MTPWWPLTQLMLRSQVWLCNEMDFDQVPSLWRNKPVESNIVNLGSMSRSILLRVTLPKDHCVKSDGNRSNVVDTVTNFQMILQKYHLLHATYYIQNGRSNSLFLNKVQVRQKEKKGTNRGKRNKYPLADIHQTSCMTDWQCYMITYLCICSITVPLFLCPILKYENEITGKVGGWKQE